jgi:hypothetical protein
VEVVLEVEASVEVEVVEAGKNSTYLLYISTDPLYKGLFFLFVFVLTFNSK